MALYNGMKQIYQHQSILKVAVYPTKPLHGSKVLGHWYRYRYNGQDEKKLTALHLENILQFAWEKDSNHFPSHMTRVSPREPGRGAEERCPASRDSTTAFLAEGYVEHPKAACWGILLESGLFHVLQPSFLPSQETCVRCAAY